MAALRVAFAGDVPAVAAAVVLAGHELVSVIVPTATRAWRKRHPVEALARAARCRARAVAGRARGDGALLGSGADLLVTCGWPWRVPATTLGRFPAGAVNVHPSLLPRHRGPDPVAWSLLVGDRECGATVHRMEASFDAGPMLGAASLPVLPTDDRGSLLDRTLSAGAVALLRILSACTSELPEGTPQDAALATYESHPGDADLRFDFATDLAAHIVPRVRARTPRPGVWMQSGPDGSMLRVVGIRPLPAVVGAEPGRVVAAIGAALRVAGVDASFWLACADLPRRVRVGASLRRVPLVGRPSPRPLTRP